MRTFIVGMLGVMLAGCPDKAPVPTTVVHVDLACTGSSCSPASLPDCSTSGEAQVTDVTSEVEVASDVDAREIAGYIQVQYRNYGNGTYFNDHMLGVDDKATVYSAWTFEPLYELTVTGEPVGIATDKLLSEDDSSLTFGYEAYQASVIEVHHIDAPRVIHLEANVPGPFDDACCSAAHPQDGALVMVVLVLLRFGRVRRAAVVGRARRLQRLRW